MQSCISFSLFCCPRISWMWGCLYGFRGSVMSQSKNKVVLNSSKLPDFDWNQSVSIATLVLYSAFLLLYYIHFFTQAPPLTQLLIRSKWPQPRVRPGPDPKSALIWLFVSVLGFCYRAKLKCWLSGNVNDASLHLCPFPPSQDGPRLYLEPHWRKIKYKNQIKSNCRLFTMKLNWKTVTLFPATLFNIIWMLSGASTSHSPYQYAGMELRT